MRDSLFMVSILVALTGCSNDLETDLAACKAKAAPATSGQKWSDFIRECMRDEGWPLKDACLDKVAWWDTPECYLR
jgi:hypothetical protein